MVKKLFILALIFLFLAVTVPTFAKTQAEKDQDQARAVNLAIGLVAFVGIFFMLDKMGADKGVNNKPTDLRLQDSNLKIGLDYCSPYTAPDGHSNVFLPEENESQIPMIKLTYSW